MVKYIKYVIGILLFFCLTQNFCTTKTNLQVPHYRQIHVRIAVDSSYVTSRYWADNITKLMDAVNVVYRSWAEVEFVTDSLFIIDFNPKIKCPDMFENECLISNIPKKNSDLVICFSKVSRYQDYYLAGLAAIDFGFVFVNQKGWHDAQEPFKWAFITLVHELGHQFGALHIQPEKNINFIMEPTMSDYTLENYGKGVHFTDPEFDPKNAKIVFALAKSRPFAMSFWGKETWDLIEKTYSQEISECSSLQLIQNRCNSGNQFRFYLFDSYFFKAEFASMCGLDSIALNYADSINLLIPFLKATDAHTRAKLIGQSYGSNWVRYNKRMYHYLKTMIYCRAKKFELAESEFNLYKEISKELDISVIYLDKEVVFFNWLKKFYSEKENQK